MALAVKAPRKPKKSAAVPRASMEMKAGRSGERNAG